MFRVRPYKISLASQTPRVSHPQVETLERTHRFIDRSMPSRYLVDHVTGNQRGFR